MSNKSLIIGSGSRVGQMLRAVMRDLENIDWLPSATWRVENGPELLKPHIQTYDSVFCLIGATPGAGVDFGLNVEVANAVCAAAQGAHVFLASSMAVYGHMEQPACESSEPQSPNAYGASKFEMEQVAGSFGARVTSLRLGNVMGADMLAGNLASGAEMKLHIFPDGRGPRRSYIDPEKLADCLQRLFELAASDQPLPAVLNVSSNPALDMGDILRAMGIGFQEIEAPEQALQSAEMDISRLTALIPEMANPVPVKDAVAAWRRTEALL